MSTLISQYNLYIRAETIGPTLYKVVKVFSEESNDYFPFFLY